MNIRNIRSIRVKRECIMNAIDKKYSELTYKIIGCAMEVHNTLGCGFLEYVYHDAFKYELEKADLKFEHEKDFKIYYKDTILEHTYRIDFFIENQIGVELKALKEITDYERAVTINYVMSGNIDLTLLFNFGEMRLKYEKYINRKYL